jgi:lipoprotein NlpI
MHKLAQTPTLTVEAQIAQLEHLLAVRRLTITDRRQAPDPRRDLGRRLAQRGIR